jgi:hypothetical protein
MGFDMYTNESSIAELKLQTYKLAVKYGTGVESDQATGCAG